MGWTLPKQEVRTFERNMLAAVVVQLRFHPILKVTDAECLAQFQERVRPRFPGYESVEGQSIEIASTGVRLRKETAHRFPGADEPAVLSLSTASLSLEYSAHRDRDVFLADAKMVLDALAAVYAPIVPVRLGLRYVNSIQRERVGDELGRPVTWAELLNPAFAVPPGGVATLDEATNFVVELSSPCARGSMTLRYGALVDGPGTTPHFRLDTDRYVEGGFALDDVESLLKLFSEDIFQVFMTAAGPALLEWMVKPSQKT